MPLEHECLLVKFNWVIEQKCVSFEAADNDIESESWKVNIVPLGPFARSTLRWKHGPQSRVRPSRVVITPCLNKGCAAFSPHTMCFIVKSCQATTCNVNVTSARQQLLSWSSGTRVHSRLRSTSPTTMPISIPRSCFTSFAEFTNRVKPRSVVHHLYSCNRKEVNLKPLFSLVYLFPAMFQS